MGDEAFNEEPQFEPDLDELIADTPDFRITVAPERLTVMPWFVLMIPRDCPAGNLFRPLEPAGITIADARSEREHEPHALTVTYLVHGGGRTAERKLLRWASQVGYGRVWLPDRLVEIEPKEMTGRAGCTCPSCSIDWEDHTTEVWTRVRDDGHFPYCCPLCGGDLPQWTVRLGQRKKNPAERG